MGKRGPKPKFTLEEQIAMGNPGHRKKPRDGAKSAEPEASKPADPTPPKKEKLEASTSALLKPPVHLTKFAQAVWSDLAPSLVESGSLTGVEKYLFVEYCQSVGRALEYVEKLKKAGGEYVKTSNSGSGTVRKEVALRDEAWERSREIAPLLGIGFKSRAAQDKITTQGQKVTTPPEQQAGNTPPLEPEKPDDDSNGNGRTTAAYSKFDSILD